MKREVSLIGVGIVAVVVGAWGAAPRAAAPKGETQTQSAFANGFAVTNVRVFDGEKAIERATVVVRDGKIAAVGAAVTAPAGVQVIDGAGRTLLPGFIDAHTHSWGDALERALVFGVTTNLDMFTDHAQVAQWRREQAEGKASRRADIFSAGTLVTAPKGHGTQFGLPIPTITAASEAQAFVDARIAEGSDYIKIVSDDGSSYGMTLPTVSRDVLAAVITAAKARGKLAVVHVGSHADADAAIAAGASGLVHIFGDRPPADDFAARVKKAGAFIIPTLTVTGSVGGSTSSESLVKHPSLGPFLTVAERTNMSAAFPQRAGGKVRLENAISAVARLHAAGVPILAGSDAPNPGTAHGATLHREIELLVQAGLTPLEALRAATAAPADAFRLGDRGRIVAGARADLLLVEGDPTKDITATRAIVNVWKGGARLDRQRAPTEAQAAQAVTAGKISDFNDGQPSVAFGMPWQVSTDSMMGGASEAKLAVVSGALEVTGAIKEGAPFPWAGAMFFPATPPMTPANLSKFTELVFRAKGDGREYMVMMFATRFGNIPMSQPFTAGAEWKEFVIPLKAFSNMDGSDVRGILFSANATPGTFRLAIDDVLLR